MASSQPTSPPPSARIYIGNLPYTAQPSDIHTFLASSGFQIAHLDMSIDPFSGRNPSYCFADLPSADEAQRAIALLPGANFQGRPLRVNVHTPKRREGNLTTKEKFGIRPAHSPFTTECGWRAVPPHNEPAPPSKEGDRPGYVFKRWARDDAESHWTRPVEQGCRLWVGGLPRVDGQEIVNVMMRELFGDYEIQAVSKMVSPHGMTVELPGDHYYCFVDLREAEEAREAAGRLHGVASPWGSGNVRVRVARDGDRKVVREQWLQGKSEGMEKPGVKRDLGGSWRTAA
ncbi:RNA recognition motif-containing protein 16 [Elsinoe australis]|uniref:RNA recognition motif-containing protein 16 n=1 Tax=Elsinoe australis TaxID=40998 RepID=A0A4V6DU24_9PEZI|nr:RNA recognition motif-containing protein 16 [Elsinoe australis]